MLRRGVAIADICTKCVFRRIRSVIPAQTDQSFRGFRNAPHRSRRQDGDEGQRRPLFLTSSSLIWPQSVMTLAECVGRARSFAGVLGRRSGSFSGATPAPGLIRAVRRHRGDADRPRAALRGAS